MDIVLIAGILNSRLWFAVPLIVAVSLVYAATRHEMMAPILEELRQEYAGQFEVVFIDVWKKKSEAGEYTLSPSKPFSAELLSTSDRSKASMPCRNQPPPYSDCPSGENATEYITTAPACP